MLLILTIGVAALLVVIGRLSFQLNRTAAEVEHTARQCRELIPSIRRVADRAEEDLATLRSVGEHTARIAEDIQQVTGQASGLTVRLLRTAEDMVVDRAHAAVAGARAGFDALHKQGNGNGHDSSGDVPHESSLKGDQHE
jgi:hypothetical protein